MTNSLDYRSAGVNIDAGNELVKRIKPFAKRTQRPEMLAGIGGFNALFEIPLDRYKKPVLVSGTDGVGTKLKLALQLNKHDTIGIDLVAMCVNDVIVCGAEPLFFLDYYATSQLEIDVAEKVIQGIAHGCELAGCSLVGGETAEMPGFYAKSEYDVAGFCVGIVEKDRIISGQNVQAGDQIIGLASSGAHSNGYSLIRKIIEVKKWDLTKLIEGKSLGELLLAPTKIYVKSILALQQSCTIKAIAHITGGGLLENIPRVLPADLSATLQAKQWHRPALFQLLREAGNITDQEMWRTFNNGIGMVLVVAKDQVNSALQSLKQSGEVATVIGEIIKAPSDQRVVIND